MKVSIFVSIFIVVVNAGSLSFHRCQNTKDKVERLQFTIHFYFPVYKTMAVLLLFVLHDVTYFHCAFPYIYSTQVLLIADLYTCMVFRVDPRKRISKQPFLWMETILAKAREIFAKESLVCTTSRPVHHVDRIIYKSMYPYCILSFKLYMHGSNQGITKLLVTITVQLNWIWIENHFVHLLRKLQHQVLHWHHLSRINKKQYKPV